MRLSILAIGIVLVMSPVAMGQADIFYDRFDCYCTPNPCPTNFCTPSSTSSVGALRATWPWASWNYNTARLGGVNATIEDNQEILSTAPYGMRHANGGDEGSQLGQNQVNLAPYIASALPGYSAANGSDAQPLILRFHFSGGVDPANGVHYSNGYMELALTDEIVPPRTPAASDQAPTDYVMVGSQETEDGCESCYATCPSPHFSVHVAWPSICQSYEPRTASPDPCPPLQTNVRQVIACGALAMLDNNPCHCENPADQVPQNWHLSLYDGLKWRILRESMFPGYGDFTLGDKLNYVVLTIKTSTMDVLHYTRVANVWTTSEAYGVPRQYLGGFNVLRAGTGVGCELNNGSYSCVNGNIAGMKPIRMGDFRCDGGGWQLNKSKFISFDRVRLLGGVGGVIEGACCLPDLSCVFATDQNCATMGGKFQGNGTNCAGTVCCATPFADSDLDKDVDQVDFGAFQVCYTGSTTGVPSGCKCFDRNEDNKVDGADYTQFNNCYTGGNVPWNPSLTPGCSP
ncbi:MAG TPA: hypothetical protein VLM89_16460 [Phycisphaerae bacterium]|nr:hypothetical protein [Phycisphaerae bacterium]